MATQHDLTAYTNSPPGGVYGDDLLLTFRTPSTTFVATDTYRLWRIERDMSIAGLTVGNTGSGGGAGTDITFRLNDGSTQVTLIDQAQIATTNTITNINVAAGLGYVVPTRGFWLEILGATVSSGTACVIGVSLRLAGRRWGDNVV